MKTKMSDLEIRWREFRATLGDTVPDEIEFSGPRTRNAKAAHRRPHPYPQLDGLKGRAYYKAYARLRRAQLKLKEAA